jgi:hypothetical protein
MFASVAPYTYRFPKLFDKIAAGLKPIIIFNVERTLAKIVYENNTFELKHKTSDVKQSIDMICHNGGTLLPMSMLAYYQIRDLYKDHPNLPIIANNGLVTQISQKSLPVYRHNIRPNFMFFLQKLNKFIYDEAIFDVAVKHMDYLLSVVYRGDLLTRKKLEIFMQDRLEELTNDSNGLKMKLSNMTFGDYHLISLEPETVKNKNNALDFVLPDIVNHDSFFIVLDDDENILNAARENDVEVIGVNSHYYNDGKNKSPFDNFIHEDETVDLLRAIGLSSVY